MYGISSRYYSVNNRKFPADEDVISIIESFGFNLLHSMSARPTKPGQIVMECDELTREKFRNLKSDDLKQVRPDWAARFIHAPIW